MKVIVRCVLFVALIFIGTSAFAQEAYPSRPITLVVPFPPGGVADIVGRPVADAMSRHLNSPVVVENKPAAAGSDQKIQARGPAKVHCLLSGVEAVLLS